jgi:hypothetical protein
MRRPFNLFAASLLVGGGLGCTQARQADDPEPVRHPAHCACLKDPDGKCKCNHLDGVCRCREGEPSPAVPGGD